MGLLLLLKLESGVHWKRCKIYDFKRPRQPNALMKTIFRDIFVSNFVILKN